jgi:hypothetical protein
VKEGGTVYVLLPARDAGRDATDTPDALTGELRDRVRSLERQLEQEREANRENRRLLAAALERIPAIEAPQRPTVEPPHGPGPTETPTEGSRAPQSGWESLRDEPERERAKDFGPTPRSSTPGTQEATERPWWRRIFGG